MNNLKRTLVASVISLSLYGSALATPEQCSHLLQQADGYDPYVCGADSQPGIIWPEGTDTAKDNGVPYGHWKVIPGEDDDLMARLPNPRPDEGPYVAVIQNEEQSFLHTAQVTSLPACKNLAKAILHVQIMLEVVAHRTTKDEGMDNWGRSTPISTPTEVICVPPYGRPVTYDVYTLAEEEAKGLTK